MTKCIMLRLFYSLLLVTPIYANGNIRIIRTIPHERIRHPGELSQHASLSSFATSGLKEIEPIQIFRDLVGMDIELEITDAYTDKKSGIVHIYARQLYNGHPILNAVGNINIYNGGVIIASYHRFTDQFGAPDVDATIDEKKALDCFREYRLNHDIEAEHIKLMYLRTESGTLDLIWHFYVREGDSYWDVSIDAMHEAGQVLELADRVHNIHKPFQYNVYAPPAVNPDGVVGRTLQEEPFNAEYAPAGWNEYSDGTVFPSTNGNNVIANYHEEGRLAQSDENGVFDFDIDFDADPEDYIDACITQLFYACNWMHDVYYAYGFDEASGNFQMDNYERGGKDNDPVVAVCQAEGTNNAQFWTTEDGESGTMKMFIWTYTDPRRDSSLDNGVIFHEYTHGISNRLTGGPSTARCLSSFMSGGMGEGWSDFSSLMFMFKHDDARMDLYPVGAYLIDDINGIRHYPYTSDTASNPTLWSYSALSDYATSVHSLGEIWAITLFEVYWNLVDTYGYDSDWISGSGGNNMMIQIVTDGMKLQPCDPTFLDARDGIVEAAFIVYGADVQKLVWDGFARRGLGVAASVRGKDSFEVPDELCGDCVFAKASKGCSDNIVEDCVCDVDDYCCNVMWDSICVMKAVNCDCAISAVVIAENKWKSCNIGCYDMDSEYSESSTPTGIRVQVTNDEAKPAINMKRLKGLDENGLDGVSINRIFQMLKSPSGTNFYVEFDQNCGYPIQIQPRETKEWSFTVKSLSPLKVCAGSSSQDENGDQSKGERTLNTAELVAFAIVVTVIVAALLWGAQWIVRRRKIRGTGMSVNTSLLGSERRQTSYTELSSDV